MLYSDVTGLRFPGFGQARLDLFGPWAGLFYVGLRAGSRAFPKNIKFTISLCIKHNFFLVNYFLTLLMTINLARPKIGHFVPVKSIKIVKLIILHKYLTKNWLFLSLKKPARILGFEDWASGGPSLRKIVFTGPACDSSHHKSILDVASTSV